MSLPDLSLKQRFVPCVYQKVKIYKKFVTFILKI